MLTADTKTITHKHNYSKKLELVEMRDLTQNYKTTKHVILNYIKIFI